MGIGIVNLQWKLDEARKEPQWHCRFHPTHGFHEVGCPHMEWTIEQLQSALTDARAMHRVYQHELWSLPLDGKPVVSSDMSRSTLPHVNVISPTRTYRDLREEIGKDKAMEYVVKRLRALADHIALDKEPWLCAADIPRENDVADEVDSETRTLVEFRVVLTYPWGG